MDDKIHNWRIFLAPAEQLCIKNLLIKLPIFGSTWCGKVFLIFFLLWFFNVIKRKKKNGLLIEFCFNDIKIKEGIFIQNGLTFDGFEKNWTAVQSKKEGSHSILHPRKCYFFTKESTQAHSGMKFDKSVIMQSHNVCIKVSIIM